MWKNSGSRLSPSSGGTSNYMLLTRLTPSTETELHEVNKNTKCVQSFDLQNYKWQLQSLSLPTSDLFWPFGCDESFLSPWAGQRLSVYFKALKKFKFSLSHSRFWLLARLSFSKVVAKQARNDLKYNMHVSEWLHLCVTVKARWGCFCSAICVYISCSKVTFRFCIVHIPYKAVASAWPRQPAWHSFLCFSCAAASTLLHRCVSCPPVLVLLCVGLRHIVTMQKDSSLLTYLLT